MRIPCIIANWKMFKTAQEAIVFTKELKNLISNISHINIVIAPPFTALHTVVDVAYGTKISVASQNVHWEQDGPYTGEVSARMLREVGVKHVIVGHSERRQLFNETDATVNKKLKTSLTNNLVPIVCIGESLEEHEEGLSLNVIDQQLRDGLANIDATQVENLIIAYEPIWAIGTGKNATPTQAGKVHAHIRKRLFESFGKNASVSCHLIYGGSVKPDNIKELIMQPDIDGALVGGASLDVRSFFEIITDSLMKGTN